MKLGDRLIKLRREKKKTQQEVADKLNISRSAYAGYETDRRVPEYSTLENMANYFDVSIDYLVGRSDDPTPVHNEDSAVVLDRMLDMDLGDKEIMKKVKFRIDGVYLTPKEIKKFLAVVRLDREMDDE